MGRVLDFSALIALVVAVYAVQVAVAPALTETKNEIQQGDDSNIPNADANIDAMYTMVVKWVPFSILFGFTVLIGYREYRRQRVAARRGL